MNCKKILSISLLVSCLVIIPSFIFAEDVADDNDDVVGKTVEQTISAKATLTTVVVSPASASLAVGATQQLSAKAYDQKGKKISGAKFTWASSNTSVATVSTKGLVKAIAPGTANITATSKGVTSAPSVISVLTPGIQITSVPARGVKGSAVGKVVGVLSSNYSQYKVAVYIKVSYGWWTKPYFTSPATTIQSNGTWSANIATGGSDEYASEVRAYLVPSTFSIPLASGQTSLPSSLSAYPYAVAYR